MPFPSNVAPHVVAWFDGSQPQYSDASGTALVSAVRAPVRRVNEASPLSGNWAASNDAQRPGRDLYGLRSDIIGPSSLIRSAAVSVSFQDSTVAVSFVARGNTFSSAQGLIVCRGGTKNYGLTLFQGNVLGLYYDLGLVYVTTIPTPAMGSRCTIVAVFKAATVEVKMIVNGVTTDYVVTPGFASLATGSAPELFPALVGGALYGSMAQAIICDQAISAADATALAAWCDSQPLTEAFPLDGRLLFLLGDSITANAPGWSNSVLAALRPTYPEMDLCNQAVSGSFSSTLSSQYSACVPYWSAARTRNILAIAIGTNDLANGGISAETVRDNTLAQVDAAHAQFGNRIVVGGVLHRYFAGDPVAQAAFDAKRATLKGYLSVAASAHGYTYVDVTSLEAYPASNPTYFPDGLHPGPAFYPLMGAVYQPAIASAMGNSRSASRSRRCIRR